MVFEASLTSRPRRSTRWTPSPTVFGSRTMHVSWFAGAIRGNVPSKMATNCRQERIKNAISTSANQASVNCDAPQSFPRKLLPTVVRIGSTVRLLVGFWSFSRSSIS